MRYIKVFGVGLLTFIITTVLIFVLSYNIAFVMDLGYVSIISILIMPLLLAVLTGLAWFIKTAPDDSSEKEKELKTNNMQVFRRGAWSGVVVGVLVSLGGIPWFIYQPYTSKPYDPVNAMIVIFGAILVNALVILIAMAFIQIIIYFIFVILTRRNIEISGTKKWVVYSFEIIIAFLVGILILYIGNLALS
jgi:hypothetical protein